MFVPKVSEVPLVTPLPPQLAWDRSTPMPPPAPEREPSKPIAPGAEPSFVSGVGAEAEPAFTASSPSPPATYSVPGATGFGAAADSGLPRAAAADAWLAAAQHEATRAYAVVALLPGADLPVAP